MKKNKTEKLANYSVMLIALVALVVSVWQVKLFQDHNKLSVKPYLDFSLVQIDSTLTVTFSNKGLGPAIIKSIKYDYNGDTYTSLEKLLLASGEMKNTLGRYNYSENSIVSNGDEKFLLKLLDSKPRGVDVTIVYETIYEDRHVFRFSF